MIPLTAESGEVVMAQQTILFTAMPRGASVNSKTLPVSVYVSPRLIGENSLGKFPDWLNWTQKLQSGGLSLTFRCGLKTLSLKIDQKILRPELWAAMFN